MYADHVPIINAAMRADPDVFAQGVLFAFASARIQFVKVPDVLDDIRHRGDKSPHLFSWKRDAYRYLQANKRDLWLRVCAETDTRKALRIICEIPGVGLTKGAFVLQFLGHDIACLDSRNADREGLDANYYMKAKNAKGVLCERRLEHYCRLAMGRARELWDIWCEQIAGIYGHTPEYISVCHVDEIVPKRLRRIAPVQPVKMLADEDIPF